MGGKLPVRWPADRGRRRPPVSGQGHSHGG